MKRTYNPLRDVALERQRRTINKWIAITATWFVVLVIATEIAISFIGG